MPRLALNKHALHQQTARLRTFRRFLPSLDLKRRQLIAERAKAAAALALTRRAMAELEAAVARELPMLADRRVDLRDLVRVTGVALDRENLLGAQLPVLREVAVTVRDYGLLVRPHWVDHTAQRLGEMLELRVREQVQQRRLELLEAAVRKITQRVNLFDKVLIPRTEAHIRRIRIVLADAERAGVVRAKLAKARQAGGG